MENHPSYSTGVILGVLTIIIFLFGIISFFIFLSREKLRRKKCIHCKTDNFITELHYCVSCRKNEFGDLVSEKQIEIDKTNSADSLQNRKKINRYLLFIFLALGILAAIFTINKIVK